MEEPQVYSSGNRAALPRRLFLRLLALFRITGLYGIILADDRSDIVRRLRAPENWRSG